jgi:carbon monoxide dehydrogenase subunit G
MEITGSYLLPCSPETAWQALNDTDVLKSCLKGCEALERTAEHEFTGKVAAKIGPVSARFSGTMRQTELDPPRSCRMQFEGQGGVAGFAKGGALVTLAVREGGTELTYVADTQIGGKLAQMGAAAVAAMEAEASSAAAPEQDTPQAEQASGAPAWLLPVVIAAMAVAAVVLFLQ